MPPALTDRASSTASPIASRTGSWLALSLGAPASVALGFFAGWLLGAVVLRSVEHAVLEEVRA